jgi:hypothetical protein
MSTRPHCSHHFCVGEETLERVAQNDVRIGDGGNSHLELRRHDGQEYVYKRYNDEYLSILNPPALDGLIDWRLGLAEQEQRRLDRLTAWPRHTVCDGTYILGILIPPAESRFWTDLGAGVREPCRLGSFMEIRNDGEYTPGRPASVRRRALGHAVIALLWLHAHGVTVNDVHSENILCAGDGSAIYLIDCDSTFGPWGRPCPPGAPDMMRSVVPEADDPTPATDIARMCWTIRWLMLQEIFKGWDDTRAYELTELMDVPTERLLARCTAARRDSEVPVTELDQMARWWTQPTIHEPSGPPNASALRGPQARRRMARLPGQWIPGYLRDRIEAAPPSRTGERAEVAQERLPPWLIPLILFTLAVALIAAMLAFEDGTEGALPPWPL